MEKPALKNVEPFKTVLSGNREAIAKLSLRDLEKIILATLTGMTTDELTPKYWTVISMKYDWKRIFAFDVS